jgi:hypothetical protein
MGRRLATGLVLALLTLGPAFVLADVPERARAHQKRANAGAPTERSCLAAGDDQTINALLSDGACLVLGRGASCDALPRLPTTPALAPALHPVLTHFCSAMQADLEHASLCAPARASSSRGQ